MSNGVTGDELLSVAVLVPLVLASPPIYCMLLFRPKRFLAWQIRLWQRLFNFERNPGEEWPEMKIDPWPSAVFRFFLGAPSGDVFLYAADEPERFPRVLVQIRLLGLLLLLMWAVWAIRLLCLFVSGSGNLNMLQICLTEELTWLTAL